MYYVPLALAVQSGVLSASCINSSSELPGIHGWTDSTHRATGFVVGGAVSISVDSELWSKHTGI